MTKEKDTFIEKLLDTYDEDFLVLPDETKDIESIPTGSISLDIATGIGGIPIGRFTEIFGPEASAKTTLCLSIAKSAIKSGRKVLYVDQENTLDFSYIKAITGEDFDSKMFKLVHPETAEQALGICELGIDSKEFGLIVVDSVGALSPEKEQEDKLEDKHMALIPKLLAAFLRRNAYKVNNGDIAFIFVNQVRDKFGAFIPTFERPGGHALKHFEALAISLWKSKNIEYGDQVVGILSRFTIAKNKLAWPFKSFYFPMMFGKGIDYVSDVVDFAEFAGILEKRGAYYTFEGETIGQGAVKTREKLSSDKELLDKIVQKIYSMSNDIKYAVKKKE